MKNKNGRRKTKEERIEGNKERKLKKENIPVLRDLILFIRMC
jgi:hypothetical protein